MKANSYKYILLVNSVSVLVNCQILVDNKTTTNRKSEKLLESKTERNVNLNKYAISACKKMTQK